LQLLPPGRSIGSPRGDKILGQSVLNILDYFIGVIMGYEISFHQAVVSTCASVSYPVYILDKLVYVIVFSYFTFLDLDNLVA
jgi:hypothetical protein